MKSYMEFLKERNPFHPGEMTISRFEKYLDDGYYITFTSIDKTGINPKSPYQTPLGVYAYPLYAPKFQQKYKSAAKEFGNVEHPTDALIHTISNSVQFMGSSPAFIRVLKEKPTARIFHTSNSEYTWDDIKSSKSIGVLEKFRKRAGKMNDETFMSIMKGETPVGVVIPGGINHTRDSVPQVRMNEDLPGIKSTPLCFVWALTRAIAVHPKLWGACLYELGFDGISDDAAFGLIHPNEMFQTVFFNRFVLEEEVIIPYVYSKTKKEQSERLRSYNIAMSYLKKGKPSQKISSVLKAMTGGYSSQNPYTSEETTAFWKLTMQLDDRDLYPIIKYVVTNPNFSQRLPDEIVAVLEDEEVIKKNPDSVALLFPRSAAMLGFLQRHMGSDMPTKDAGELGVMLFNRYVNLRDSGQRKFLEEYFGSPGFAPDARGYDALSLGGKHLVAFARAFDKRTPDEWFYEFLGIHPDVIDSIPQHRWTPRLLGMLVMNTGYIKEIASASPNAIPKEMLDDATYSKRNRLAWLKRAAEGLVANRAMTPKEKKATANSIIELAEDWFEDQENDSIDYHHETVGVIDALLYEITKD